MGSTKMNIMMLLASVVTGLWYFMPSNNQDSLRGKRVIITGASGGIGEAVAYEYAKLGANVVVTARRKEQLDKVVSKCQQLGPSNSSHKAITADMKMVESIGSLVEQAVNHLGGLDILVLNHITKTPIMPFTGDEDSIRRVFNAMDINFRSYVEATALAMPHLTDSQGAIVVVNSIMGHISNPKVAPYSSSKFALNGFFGALRSQFILERRNVAVTSCILGLIDTPSALDDLKASGSTALDYVTPASTQAAANAIVAGSRSRVDTVYFPYLATRLHLQVLNQFFPSLGDAIQRYVFEN